MINKESIEKVAASQFSKKFIKPLYDSFCFSQIPASVVSLLTGAKGGLPSSCFLRQEEAYDTVIVLFLDGFAWRFFEKHMSHPFCRRFLEEGMVSKLTAQFPSTTAAEVTTINTGLEVGETGIYEWFQYEPQVDRIIAPLPFTYAGDKAHEALLATGIPPSKFFPFKTVYETLHEEGVTSYIFQPASISGSAYSQCMTKGAHPSAFLSLAQGLESVKELISSKKHEKTYALFYYPEIDSAGHHKGVDSKEHAEAILKALDALEAFMGSVEKTEKKTAIMLTADHGMTQVEPKKTIYLNQVYPKIATFLEKNAQGNLLAPAGSCRDFFLHIKEECLDEAFEYLSESLKDKAEVWKVSDLMAEGFFGRHLSIRFLERVGNLVILPYEGEAVWWYEKHRFEQHFYGAHGGLTRQEIEIPLLFTHL